MRTDIGWLSVTSETSVENRFTGERLIYRGPLSTGPRKALRPPKTIYNRPFYAWPSHKDEKPIETEAWFILDYVCAELRVPIAISTIRRYGNNNLIVLDYNLSADLAKRNNLIGGSRFGYGLWKRLDAFVVEALLVMKLDVYLEYGSFRLVTLGGWANGRWEKALRSSLRLPSHPRQGSALEILHRSVPPTPLDSKPPPRWTYRALPEEHASSGSGTAPVRNLPQELFPSGYDIDPHGALPDHWPRIDGLAVLPRLWGPKCSREQRQSIIGQTPCLISEDGERLLYMASAQKAGKEVFRGDDLVWQNWIYSDDRLTCTVRMWSGDGSLLMANLMKVSLTDFENELKLTNGMSATALNEWSPDDTPNLWVDFTVSLHAAVWDSIADGMMTWEGSEARHEHWSPFASLKYPLLLWRPVYLFGYAGFGHRCSWLDQTGPKS